MKTTFWRSIAASRNGPSEKSAGAPRNGSDDRLRALRVAGQRAVGEQAGDAAFVEPAPDREHRVDAAERRSCAACARGASAASVSLMRRALSSYMIIATGRPLLVADHAQRLEAAEVGAEGEHAAALGQAPCIASTPLAVKVNSSKRSCSR